MPLELRSNRVQPSSAPNSCKDWVTALCAMASMREVAATEPPSATATK